MYSVETKMIAWWYVQDLSDAYVDAVVAKPGGREAAERATYHKRLHIRSAGSDRQNVGELIEPPRVAHIILNLEIRYFSGKGADGDACRRCFSRVACHTAEM